MASIRPAFARQSVFPSPSTHLVWLLHFRSIRYSCPLSSSSFADQAKMSDNEYAIESTDAGASETIPMEAGQIKKGG